MLLRHLKYSYKKTILTTVSKASIKNLFQNTGTTWNVNIITTFVVKFQRWIYQMKNNGLWKWPHEI